MAEPALEDRIRILEDLEAIKRLKSRYWYCLDHKLWDEYAECLTEDIVVDTPIRPRSEGLGRRRTEGRDVFIDFLKKRLGNCITIHQGHSPDIKITGNEARGRWALHDVIIDDQQKTVFSGRGYYEDIYVKIKGEWKIKSIKLNRLLSETYERT